MDAVFPIGHGLSLRTGDARVDAGQFPTARLARGLLLQDGEHELAEEAVGFGVPVAKKGLVTLFPGEVVLDVRHVGDSWKINAHYNLNLVERFSRPGHRNLGGAWLYDLKNLLSAAIRRVPATRSPLTSLSSRLRRMLRLRTTYVDAHFETGVDLSYTSSASEGSFLIEMDAGNLHPDITELVLMHEQGALAFDRYQDGSGVREEGQRIGLWDPVRAREAWFESSVHRVAFKVRQMAGAQLFRGRELIEGRLAWAGFGYSFRPPVRNSTHEVLITRLA